MLHNSYITTLTNHNVPGSQGIPGSQSMKESFHVSDLIINNASFIRFVRFFLLEYYRNYIINNELRNRFEPLTGCARKSVTKIYID